MSQNEEGAEIQERELVACPFASLDETSQVIRRCDIKELGDTFKAALNPLTHILNHMKDSNARWSASHHQLKRVVRTQVGLVVLNAVSLFLLFYALWYLQWSLAALELNAKQLYEMEGDMKATTQELRSLRDSATKTTQVVNEVKDYQDKRPQLQLVAETDPVKAQRSPVKLRVIPPVTQALAPAPSASASAVVELPLLKGAL